MAKAKRTEAKTDEATTSTATRSRRGIPNRDYAPSDAQASRCPRCKSTNRGKYFRKHEVAAAGLDPSGQPYTHLVFRYCTCDDCGQHRVDRTYENRPAVASK